MKRPAKTNPTTPACSSRVSAARWLAMVVPLEPYRSRAVNPEDWRRDFQQEVDAVIEAWKAPATRTPQVFSDEERRAHGLPAGPDSEPRDLSALINSLQGQDASLALRMRTLWRYVRTANRTPDGTAPTPGDTRERFKRVVDLSAQLEAAIADVVGGMGRATDRWLDARIDEELIGDGAPWPPATVQAFAAVPAARKELHFNHPARTPLEKPPGVATRSFMHVALELLRAREFVASARIATQRGLEAIGTGAGRPHARRALIPSRLLLSIAVRYAPAPATATPRSKERTEWLGAVSRFVHFLTAETALPPVSVYVLKSILREPGVRFATAQESRGQHKTGDSPG
jgi:hypothetical protein